MDASPPATLRLVLRLDRRDRLNISLRCRQKLGHQVTVTPRIPHQSSSPATQRDCPGIDRCCSAQGPRLSRALARGLRARAQAGCRPRPHGGGGAPVRYGPGVVEVVTFGAGHPGAARLAGRGSFMSGLDSPRPRPQRRAPKAAPARSTARPSPDESAPAPATRGVALHMHTR
jgi:hypothetical protein